MMQLSISYFFSCLASTNLQLLTTLCNSPPFHQVAQYIKFEMPVLQSFITKLKEEEDREVQKLRRRYKKHIPSLCLISVFLQRNIDTWFHAILNIVYKCIFTDSNMFSFSLHLSACICRYTYLRCIIEKQLSCLPEGATCMWAAHQTVKSLPQRTTRDKDSDQGSADKNPTYVFKQPSSSSVFQPLHGLFSKPSNQSTKLKTVHVRCDCVGLRIHGGSCRLVRSNHFISLCLYLFHHTWCTQKASLLLPSRMSLNWDVLCSVFSPVYNLIPQIKVKHKHQKMLS